MDQEAQTPNSTPAPEVKKGGASKVLITLLIIVVLAAAGVYVWKTYYFTPSSNESQSQSSTGSNTSSTSSTSQSTETDASGVNEVTNDLDSDMASIDEDNLSDSQISDSNLGIE